MSLNDWKRAGWLVDHASSREEVRDLLALADRDLRDCRAAEISLDWRFAIAYNAALQCAKAALAVSGYRPARGEGGHFRVIQSLAYTLGSPKETMGQLEAFRKKRNIGEYDLAGAISETEATEVLTLAVELRKELARWMGENHPEYL